MLRVLNDGDVSRNISKDGRSNATDSGANNLWRKEVLREDADAVLLFGPPSGRVELDEGEVELDEGGVELGVPEVGGEGAMADAQLNDVLRR